MDATRRNNCLDDARVSARIATAAELINRTLHLWLRFAVWLPYLYASTYKGLAGSARLQRAAQHIISCRAVSPLAHKRAVHARLLVHTDNIIAAHRAYAARILRGSKAHQHNAFRARTRSAH